MGTPTRRRINLYTAGIVAAALVLRAIFAEQRGLVLDEFHSLYHASQPDLAAFFQGILNDNHPPLSFLLLRTIRSAFGDGEIALRAPALLFGALNLLLVARMARRVPCAIAPVIAAAALGFSTLHLDVGGQARMYALHALCVTGMIEGLLGFLETPQGRRPLEPGLLIVFWSALGLHNHYYFLHYLLLASTGVVIAAALAPHTRRRAVQLLPVAAVIATLWMPWFARGFLVQLSHKVPPGMTDVSPLKVAEALVHLVFVNVSIAGPLLRSVFITSGLLMLVLGVIGAGRLWSARVVPFGVDAPIQLLIAAIGVPLWAGLVAWIEPQAGYNWIYLAPSTPALAVLIAAAAGPGPWRALRHAGLAVGLASAAVLMVICAMSVGTENYRGAIADVLAAAGPDDAVIPVEWQPTLFPQGLAWEYYAPRLAEGTPLPARFDVHPRWFAVEESWRLASHDQVFVLRRSLPLELPFWDALSGDFEEVSVVDYGYGLWVHRFQRDY